MIAMTMAASLMAAAPAFAGWPGDTSKCKADAVKTGSVCMDKYEASVWEVPALNLAGKSNAGLIKKIQGGVVTLAQLTAGGATERGLGFTDDYPCADNGQNCKDKIYAVSIVGVKPSAAITWFQAQQACFNARKRLPTNGEWQGAAAGTPDPGPDNGSTDCNTSSVGVAVNTGSRSSCVSAWGAYDMVGNVWERVADWVTQSGGGLGSWSGSADYQGWVGAATSGEPGSLIRGGDFSFPVGTDEAGPLAIDAAIQPSESYENFLIAVGFRCAR
jgi:hypothetical protein